VIALLAVERDVLIAQALETLEREFVVRTFGLLQTKNVGTDGFYEFGDQIDAQPHRIDIPGCDLDFHCGNVVPGWSLNQHFSACHHPRGRKIRYPQAIAGRKRRGVTERGRIAGY
jgi:hypothetical protein